MVKSHLKSDFIYSFLVAEPVYLIEKIFCGLFYAIQSSFHLAVLRKPTVVYTLYKQE